MSTIRNTLVTFKAISKFSKFDDISDDCDVPIPVRHMRTVLGDIGGQLTREEMDLLIPPNCATVSALDISNTEFARTIMFVSLVICVFDREGEGSISVHDLTQAMRNFTSIYSESQLRNHVESLFYDESDECDESSDSDESENDIYYDNFVFLVNSTR